MIKNLLIRTTLCCSILLLLSATIKAQDTTHQGFHPTQEAARQLKELRKKMNKDEGGYHFLTHYVSTSFGFAVPLGLHAGTYAPLFSNTSIQLGYFFERGLNHKFSLYTGPEVDYLAFGFDANLQRKQGSSGYDLASPAPDSVKYPSLRMFVLNVPVEFRYYFGENARTRANLYLQGGFRFGYNFYSDYTRRVHHTGGGVDKEVQKLGSDANRFLFGPQIGLGVKGDKIKIRIINDTTVGLYYQLNSFFSDPNSIRLHPVILFWKLVF